MFKASLKNKKINFYRQVAVTLRKISTRCVAKTSRLGVFAVKKNRPVFPLVLAIFLLTVNCAKAQESGTSGADNKSGEKTSFKSKRKQRKEDRRLAKESRKLKKQEEKAIKEHHKRLQTKEVQKRMKKNRRRDRKNSRKYPT